MDVKSIIKQWLKDNRFDGLLNKNGCGCELSDLMPCNEDCSACTPGYKQLGREDEECEFYICAKKPTQWVNFDSFLEGLVQMCNDLECYRKQLEKKSDDDIEAACVISYAETDATMDLVARRESRNEPCKDI